MKLELTGPSGLLVEQDGFRLLVDPWFQGPCYWRSWWPLAPSAPSTLALTPHAIALTSSRPEQAHEESLRLLPKETPVFVPKFPTRRFERWLGTLGFTRVTSLPHGSVRRLCGELSIASFQTGWTSDSALVISNGSQSALLADAHNPPALEKVRDRFPSIDVLLGRSMSRGAFPDCMRSTDPSDLQDGSRRRQVQAFHTLARDCGATTAIPFGGEVGFLHRENFNCNDEVVTPDVVQSWRPPLPNHPDITLLEPGDVFDLAKGLATRDPNAQSSRREQLYRQRDAASAALEDQDRREAECTLSWDDFSRVMGRHLRTLPIALRPFFDARLAYLVRLDGQRQWWVLDFGRRTLERRLTPPLDVASTTHVPPGLLQLALDEGRVSWLESTKRIRIDITPGRLDDHRWAQELVALAEDGQFPLLLNETRFLATWIRRRESWPALARRVRRKGAPASPRTSGTLH